MTTNARSSLQLGDISSSRDGTVRLNGVTISSPMRLGFEIPVHPAASASEQRELERFRAQLERRSGA